MKFEKGHQKKGGRTSGTPNRATGDLRKSVNALLDKNWPKIQADLDALEPKDRLAFMEKLLSYSLPKLQSIEYVSDLDRLTNGLSDEQIEELLERLNQRMEENEL